MEIKNEKQVSGMNWIGTNLLFGVEVYFENATSRIYYLHPNGQLLNAEICAQGYGKQDASFVEQHTIKEIIKPLLPQDLYKPIIKPTEISETE